MSNQTEFDAWSAGQSYEHYMGRWSRKVAAGFMDRLAPPKDADWVEVGCGTGALTQAILAATSPNSVLATDQSADFVSHAAMEITDERVRFEVANAMDLPCADASLDMVVSALVMNFIPDKQKALSEMTCILKPGGRLAFYVWDYPGGGMGFIDEFWKSAGELDPDAVALNESARFPVCTKTGLEAPCQSAGIADADVEAIEIETSFADFEAFWRPFTLGAGPAPGYCKSLSPERRQSLKAHLANRLGTRGPVALSARAWAVNAQARA